MTSTDTPAAGTRCASTHAGWFADVRRIIDIVEVTPGIPLPFICADRASFYFTSIPDPGDAAEAVSAAETILGYALSATFTPDITDAGGARHYVLETFLPSGLRVSLVTRAERVLSEDYATRRLAEMHAAVAEIPAEIYAGSAA